jgi:hypothetical protein
VKGGVEMKACGKINELIAEYIDGELDEEIRLQVAEHLAACKHCKREYEDIMYVVELCRELPEEELPEGFSEQLHNKLVEEKNNQEKMNRVVLLRRRYMKIFSSIAAVLLIMVMIKGFTNNGFFMSNSAIEKAQNQVTMQAAESFPREDFQAQDAGVTPQEVQSEIAEAGATSYDTKAGASRSYDNRITSMAALANDEPKPIYSRDATITLISDDPDVQIEKLRKYANTKRVELIEDKDADDGKEVSANLKTVKVLKIKVPYSTYEQFINLLISDFSSSTIEFGQENAKDMTPVIDELNDKLGELQNRIINSMENTGSISGPEDITDLKAERENIMDEIERIEMESNYIYVTLLFASN